MFDFIINVLASFFAKFFETRISRAATPTLVAPAEPRSVSALLCWRSYPYGGTLWEPLHTGLKNPYDTKSAGGVVNEQTVVDALKQEFLSRIEINSKHVHPPLSTSNCLVHVLHTVLLLQDDLKISLDKMKLVSGVYEGGGTKQHYGIIITLADGEVLVDPTFNRYV
jgi:hypothetical protein